jgi:hypothetical protein
MSNARKDEAKAVRTTIVGGRPPGSGRNNVPVPRGIEVLVKKASVDAEFRELLLKQRGKAAATIQLELDPAENTMLSAIPREQLAQIVDHTTVPMELRTAFMGRVAPVMLAALGVSLAASSLDAQLLIRANPTSNPLDGTTTSVPLPNDEITNPPPPQTPFIVAGLMMPVPPPISPTNPPSTNAPSPTTNAVQPDLPVIIAGLMRTPPANPPPTNAPSTNVISPPIRGIQPNVPVFGAMIRTPEPPPTNATPAEPTPTNPPSADQPPVN